jgi:hypothetical protein
MAFYAGFHFFLFCAGKDTMASAADSRIKGFKALQFSYLQNPTLGYIFRSLIHHVWKELSRPFGKPGGLSHSGLRRGSSSHAQTPAACAVLP